MDQAVEVVVVDAGGRPLGDQVGLGPLFFFGNLHMEKILQSIDILVPFDS